MMGIIRYRLQKDGTWRKIKSSVSKNHPEFDREDCFSLDDFLTEDLGKIRPYVERRGMITFEGKTYFINPAEGDLAKLATEAADILPRVHRFTKPQKFSKGKLVEVIAGGDDQRNNVLILDLKGYLRLMEYPQALDKLAPIAVRYTTFIAGNRDVGFRAAKDKENIGQIYLSMLDGWTTHLMTGKLNIFQDDLLPQENEAELWRKVDYLTEHLK